MNATNHRDEEIEDADGREQPGQSNPDGRAIVKSCDCGKGQDGRECIAVRDSIPDIVRNIETCCLRGEYLKGNIA